MLSIGVRGKLVRERMPTDYAVSSGAEALTMKIVVNKSLSEMGKATYR